MVAMLGQHLNRSHQEVLENRSLFVTLFLEDSTLKARRNLSYSINRDELQS